MWDELRKILIPDSAVIASMDTTRRTFVGTAIGIGTVALAGCTSGSPGGSGDGMNGGDGGSTGTATPTATETATPTATETATPTATGPSDGGTGSTVRTRSHPEYGEILTDADGRTLYMFDKDTKDDSSSVCSGGCASTWPPLTVDREPTKADEVTASIATFEREDGDSQVTAGGWPLYYYASDSQPGDAKGQGVGDVWWVLAADGSPIRSSASDESSY